MDMKTKKDNDFRLVLKFKGGDTSAFDELMTLYENRIYGFLVKMCACSEGAKDVLQNTFLTVFRSLDKFRGDASFKTWIYKVASTACLKEKRKNAPLFELSVEEFLSVESPYNESKKSAWLRTPVEELLNNELSENLKKSLAKLPKKYRIVLVLRDMEGLTAEEVSKTLDISTSSVKSRLHRARLFMRRELEMYYKERGTI